jgi:hypothetical protein
MNILFINYRVMQCTIGEEMQFLFEVKKGVQLKTYPIGVNIVEVAKLFCRVSDSNISREDGKGFFKTACFI